MIIGNGYIEFKLKDCKGLDSDTGYPISADVLWDKPIPCQFIQTANNKLKDADGVRFSVANYTILIEAQPLPQSEQIRLTDNVNGVCLGEFSLISSPELLQAVDQIKLIV